MNKTAETTLCPMEAAIRLKVMGVLNDQYAHGYAVYCCGLMDEDGGAMAGSGWGLSTKGVLVMRELESCDG